MRRRLSRRDLSNLYATALEMRDEARIERDNSRSICRAQAAELGRLHDELEKATRPAARTGGESAELARARRTIAALDEQLRVLEASNLELSRAAMERAGTAVKAASA